MTGYQSKKAAAQDKLEDDDTQVYQRPWQDLTDDDWDKIGDMPDTFDQGVAWAAARLKEKNT